jgi:hypothetical protein
VQQNIKCSIRSESGVLGALAMKRGRSSEQAGDFKVKLSIPMEPEERASNDE